MSRYQNSRYRAQRRKGTDAGIPFAEIAELALEHSEDLLRCWLPDGYIVGDEWLALNPTRADHCPGSFSINTVTGLWADFATEYRGGDLISLYAYLKEVSQGQAAREIQNQINRGPSSLPRRVHSNADKKVVSKAASVRSLPPIPKNRPEPNLKHPRRGKPVASWAYHNEQGQVVGFACRFNTPEGKDVLPYSWTSEGWDWKAMPEPRPLFNLPRLLEEPSSVVMVVEGEKAAVAARTLFPDLVVTTWAGGSNAWRSTDWTLLRGRKVLIWPDADEPGHKAAKAIHDFLLREIQVASSLPLKGLETLPRGWDAADALAEGWTAERLVAAFRDPQLFNSTNDPK